jgi:hypothetical protein
MRPDGLKKAFREKIKENHPDKASIKGINAKILEDKFIRIKEAYEALLPFVSGEKSIEALLNEEVDREAGTDVRSRKQTVDASGKAAKFDFYHCGPIPALKLRFSQYLYYRGRISWQQCMRSLSWQRTRRPLFGQIAMKTGFLSNMDIVSILKSMQPAEPFGETAIRLKRLTPYQVFVLLGRQSLFNAKIGRFFTEENILAEDELKQFLRDFYFHNLSFTMARN